jgi:hypothetical protein
MIYCSSTASYPPFGGNSTNDDAEIVCFASLSEFQHLFPVSGYPDFGTLVILDLCGLELVHIRIINIAKAEGRLLHQGGYLAYRIVFMVL